MDSNETHIEVHRPWRAGETIFLVGPGGVGKSSLGRELSRLLGWPLIDLDLEFCGRIGIIGPYIAKHGYDRYRQENLMLAEGLADASRGPAVFVTASGFLAGSPQSDDKVRARRLVGSGYGITLLPSLNVELATSIVVERQLARGFGLERMSEERKFRERFSIYRYLGDMLVVSTDQPARVAAEVVDKLVTSI